MLFCDPRVRLFGRQRSGVNSALDQHGWVPRQVLKPVTERSLGNNIVDHASSLSETRDQHATNSRVPNSDEAAGYGPVRDQVAVDVPPGTPHGFTVLSDSARVLNLYVPAALDTQITTLGTPATSRTLPPPGTPQTASDEQLAAFLEKIKAQSTQRWAAVDNLLGQGPLPTALEPSDARAAISRERRWTNADGSAGPRRYCHG
jgi:hypothetical protein